MPCRGLLELQDLVKKRVGMFFASAHVSIISGPLKARGIHTSPRISDIGDLVLQCFQNLEDSHMTLTTCALTFISVVDNPTQDYHFSAAVDLSTLKTTSLAVLKKWAAKIIALKKTLNEPIIPSGKSLNKLSKHPDAPRVYHRLFNVVSAYCDIIIYISRTLLQRNKRKAPAEASDTYNTLCWDTFLPNGPDSVESDHISASSIKILNYRVGQFVKKGSVFATTKEDVPIPAKSDFILLSYSIKEKSLVYTFV